MVAQLFKYRRRKVSLLAEAEADRLVELAEMFRLLGDASRLRIILACLDAPTSVGAIAERVRLSISLVSHHLRLLRAGRLVRAELQGKQVFYAVADEHVRRVIADMATHVGEPADEEGD